MWNILEALWHETNVLSDPQIVLQIGTHLPGPGWRKNGLSPPYTPPPQSNRKKLRQRAGTEAHKR